ncbi:hypothetical protein [Winogradskyella arenosi]|uniref:DUF3857 domain-containing protein n=1 Tax=Winogradskyella arenosi TaxID=533325 RepID=A0A368ZHS5_9FLAO|nr:hypothetical protein [Winogradskyella arenosi]RCW93320.1 hypothetical protein DFQ08_101112 [Winogradskyella arenosi]
MIHKILVLSFLWIYSAINAQSGPAVLILKDSTRIKGVGEISGIASIVSVKFKNDTLKYKTYRSKDLIGVDILENDYYRQFRYKYIDGDKYPEIMEIVAIDSLSLYVRVYEGGALSKSFINQPSMNVIPNQRVILENGQEIDLRSSRAVYTEMSIPRYSYYVGNGEDNQVAHLYTKGLPFSKSFKKAMKAYFKDCPTLVENVENKTFSKENLLQVIEFFNEHCYTSDSE